jgi:uncharacterized membrane protein HdeD (DUF308 family)
MTSSSESLRVSSASTGIEPLRVKWGWIVALGVVYLITGLIALGSVIMAAVASVLVVGIMMTVAGVAEVFSIPSQGLGQIPALAPAWRALHVAGFVTFENPLLAAALPTLVLGAALVASGIMRTIMLSA